MLPIRRHQIANAVSVRCTAPEVPVRMCERIRWPPVRSSGASAAVVRVSNEHLEHTVDLLLLLIQLLANV